VRVLSIVHERDAGGGVFAEAAAASGRPLCEWIPAEGPPPGGPFDAAIVFGGAMHVDQEREHAWLAGEKQLLRELLGERVPLLGVCLGAQLLAEAAGGDVRRAQRPEIGWVAVELAEGSAEDELLGPLPRRFESFQWHSYELLAPAGAAVLAHSSSCVQAFHLSEAPAWGIQFHAEATAETIAGWIRTYTTDPDAVRADVDWEAVRANTDKQIGRWNQLGRALCTRFLDAAAASRALL
jgi:GMP synthase (glutamine-hydrolysing)